MDLVARAGLFRRQAQALLPTGPAWTREEGAELTQLLGGLTVEFARADLRTADLRKEALPNSTEELLSEWEALCGLPRCLPAPTTLEARQAALVTHLRTTGAWAPTKEAIRQVAADFGHDAIEFENYKPFVAGSPVGDSLYQGDWYAVWRFVAPGPADPALECALRWLVPTHTFLIFIWE